MPFDGIAMADMRAKAMRLGDLFLALVENRCRDCVSKLPVRATRSGAAALSLKLRLLVLPDGSIFNAKVVRSTGEADFDQVAIQWVRGNWRYLPAVVNGRAVTAWVTVIVRFAPIH